METEQYKTVGDLLTAAEERVELIAGEVVQRPMARFEHALAQAAVSDEIRPFRGRGDGPGGWWIVSEISVQYGAHECPTHDLAGRRKQCLPTRPSGIMTQPPDWMFEISSPGLERKDLVHHFLLLQRVGVLHYWIIFPEDHTLIGHALDDGSFRVVFSADARQPDAPRKARVPPFEAVEIDLAFLFAEPS
jgi:Uma2 family endonuclease